MWWHNAVIYETYVRSFADSNGDGVGDIPGVTSRLDYLQWLGVDAIWLTPIMRSPGRDHGYDVSNYYDIDPVAGTHTDFDRLVADAEKRGIKVLLDLVPNHTSIEHPWFRSARTRRKYYVWTHQPNNWVSTFHIPSWTYDERERKHYLHSYLPEQPDLNWWDDEIREHFDRIQRYWYDRGVAGFRIDACYILVKDRLLRDNPAARVDDHPWDRNRGQRPVWNTNQPEVHDILRRWRSLAEEYRPPRLLMGATWVPRIDELAGYYGASDELQLPQYFQFLFARFTPPELRRIAEDWLHAVPDGQTPVWTASTHDLPRFPSRWCDGDDSLIRTALTMLLTLPGACVLYQGDELGLQDQALTDEYLRDPAGLGRDAYRTPMPWTPGAHGGFTSGRPWLPVGDPGPCNVADQMRDTGSILHHTRRLIARKKRLSGAYRLLDVSDDSWTYLRGDTKIDLSFRATRRGRDRVRGDA